MIGMGRQAYHSNVKSFLNAADAQVVAVCDVDAWRLDNAQKALEKHYAKERAAGTFKGCSAYRDFRELLDRGDIDAVMISAPDHCRGQGRQGHLLREASDPDHRRRPGAQ